MSPTVLLVEDGAELVRVLRDYLERAGFRVQTASTGPEAVSRFQHTAPDLVLLDLNLPGMDGLDVARARRRAGDGPRLLPVGAPQGTANGGQEETIDPHIKNLRAKIEPDSRHPRFVQTVFGVGY